MAEGTELPSWEVKTDDKQARFAKITNDDVNSLISNQENENTKKKTRYDLKIVKEYLLQEHKESRELAIIPPDELNIFLSQFIIAARTKTGKNYEPSSLRGILSSIDRYLGRENYGKRLFIDPEFKRMREALKARQKELKQQGYGNKPRATTALTDEEINILYDKKVLGLSSPQALINTVWLNNIQHFGLRGCKEQREVRWGDITLHTNSEGKEFLTYCERQTKTRTGEDPRNVRSAPPRMYENTEVENERNPVYVYKFYAEKRPPSMKEADSPFYLSVNHFKTSIYHELSNCFWFKALPMGQNKLDAIMKDMCKAANITVKTNHAGRKTLVQKLQDSGIPPNQIIQVTGHKNIQSVNNYSQLGERKQESISKILSSSTPSAGMAASLHSISQASTSSSFSSEKQLQTMFTNNTFHGGTFNIVLSSSPSTTQSQNSTNSVKTVKKYRRVMAIESSDSSQETD